MWTTPNTETDGLANQPSVGDSLLEFQFNTRKLIKPRQQDPLQYCPTITPVSFLQFQ